MENYMLSVSSRDRTSGSVQNYRVTVPSDLPRANYKCTVNFIIAALTPNVSYSMLCRSDAITRCLSTSVSTNFWGVAGLLNGAQNGLPCTIYFNSAPVELEFKLVVTSDGGGVNPPEHMLLMHFEKIKEKK